MIKFGLEVASIGSPSVWEVSEREEVKQTNIIYVFFNLSFLHQKNVYILSTVDTTGSELLVYNLYTKIICLEWSKKVK